MFNNGFFPTPRDVVLQMVKPYTMEFNGRCYFRQFEDLQVLEPSAGKGDIVDVLMDEYGRNRKPDNFYCIEIEDELVFILQSKGYKVIDRDFLEYSGAFDFDLILMNPPFDNGTKHLLKAWDILRNGDIVCLLNAETVRNPHTKEREVLAHLIKEYGSVEYLGQCFKDAERPTDVEVALVRLHKETAELEIEFEGDFDREGIVIDEEFLANPLAKVDMVEALVSQYDAARRLTIDINQLWKERYFYLQGAIPQYFNEPFAKKPTKGELNETLQDLNGMFWKYVFEQTAVGREMTSDFQRKFDEYRQSSAHLAFTRANVMEVFGLFIMNKGHIMEQCMNKVFDDITSFHKKNKIHVEGWVTNKSWKVARKIIWPYGVDFDKTFGNFRLSYMRDDFLQDLDKVMCYLTGKKIDDVALVTETLRHRFEELARGSPSPYTRMIYSSFFEIRFYKKGTVHLTFIDEELWQDFNVAVARSRGWLGAGY